MTSILSPSGLYEQFKKLLGAYEEKIEENEELKIKNKELTDKLRELIGEQKVPKFKDEKDKKDLHHPKPSNKDRKKNWKKKSKNDQIKIDREEKCPADKDELPADAEFKGYREVIIQNVLLKTDNVKFHLERWYSPSHKKYIEGKLPPGFKGSQFGPDLRSLVVMLYVGLRSTENKIEKFLKDLDIVISAGEISRILTNVPEKFSVEMMNARTSAIAKAPYLNIDATGMKVNGDSFFNLCHGNRYMSYHSLARDRGRLEALKSLILVPNHIYLFDQRALRWLKLRFSDNKNKLLLQLKERCSSKKYSEKEMDSFVHSLDILDNKTINLVKTSALLSAWKNNLMGAIPKTLISDSAGEYRSLLDFHQECWIHELRHYREIIISSTYVGEELDLFFELAWDLFDLMESYKMFPSRELREKIEFDFKSIFEREWNSFMINHCRKNTLDRKKNLLTFLDQYDVPIHNNEVESYIREKVVRRKISGGHKSIAGAAAGNLWISLYQTTRKNGLSFFQYLLDRFRELNQISQISKIIELRA